MSDLFLQIAGVFVMLLGLTFGSMCLFALKNLREGVEVIRNGETRMPMAVFIVFLFLLFVGCIGGGLYLTLKGFHAVR